MTHEHSEPAAGSPAGGRTPFAADPTIYARLPDGSVTYRGQPLTALLGQHFEAVWGLLVDGSPTPGLPPAEPFPLPVRTGDVRVDVQSALAQLAPVWGFRPLLDVSAERARDDLARASVMALSFVAQSARGLDLPAVPQQEVEQGSTIAERFLIRWRGEARPESAAALDSLWTVMAENGLTTSTRVARLVASTGADAAACLSGAVAAVGGPLTGGAAVRAVGLIRDADRAGDAATTVRTVLEETHLVPGFARSDELVDDTRADLVHAVCARLEVPLLDAAEAVERAAGEALQDLSDRPVRASATFWAAVLLDFAGVEPRLFNALLICGRTAGWSAHILDVQRSLLRLAPGPGAR
ncbi:citrate synthase [Georgenia wangjunii]|uniref:citrate synthase n=1 Tax=Georgenia wangjunii TaxID=3117730 RepID=UPI002F2689A8